MYTLFASKPENLSELVPQVHLAPLAGPRRASLALRAQAASGGRSQETPKQSFGFALPAMRSIVRCDRV